MECKNCFNCKKCVNILQQWDDVKSFGDLIELNKRFISGEIPFTPYHGGPIEEPTLIPNLLRLHDHGILTVDGQEGSEDQGQFQRSNVGFFAEPTSKNNRVIHRLMSDDRLDIAASDPRSGMSKMYYRVSDPVITYWFDDNGNRVDYTDYPSEHDWKNFRWSETIYCTNNSTILDILDHTWFVSVSLKKCGPCLGAAFGDPSVEEIILEYLNNIRG